MSAWGCGATCDTSDDANPPQLFNGGSVVDGVYQSSTWNLGLLHYPGGKQYLFEHHLGFTPASVEVYLGFGEDADRVSPCSGNACLVRSVNDRTFVLKNDTCAEFWVRVTASGFGGSSDGGADAGPLLDGSD